MKSKHSFYTKTLTDLYAKQGYYEDSLKGLRKLLEKEPHREDLVREIAAIEGKNRHDKNELAGLVAQWVELLRKEARIKQA